MSVPIPHWYLADVLHVRHDSKFGVGRQSLGLERVSHYDEIAVDEIRYRLSACSHLRALTIDSRSHGCRCTRPHLKSACIIELTASFGQLSRSRHLESFTGGGPDCGQWVWPLGRSWTRHRANRPPACHWHGGHPAIADGRIFARTPAYPRRPDTGCQGVGDTQTIRFGAS